MLHPVIIAGGSGSRLWPLSRQLNPKQFLKLTDTSNTMLQATVKRLPEQSRSQVMLICNEEHRFLAAEQLRQMGLDSARILLEPEGRNTAPALALAAFELLKTDDDALMLVLPADHLISDVVAFQQKLTVACAAAESGKLVTFGIVPTSPETGYGYICIEESAIGQGHSGASSVKLFVEKPSLELAQEYVKAGNYFWNSGMFVFKANRYLEELEKHRPDIYNACQKATENCTQDMVFTRINADAFRQCPEDSIDYAVMEKTDDAVMVPLDAGWSDIGSWSALWDVCEKDGDSNRLEGDVLAHSTVNTLVRAEHRLVATVGVSDLIVVETKDAVLVANKDAVQDVKQIVAMIKADGRSEHFNHREVYRPWGVYDSIDSGHRYQVKRITVQPGAKLSVQMHHHRAEHWIVVSGTAKVTNGDKTYLVSENESTYIPIGQRHSLENPGQIPLELIEVQSGSYLGEDDIVRFDDVYGRT